MAEDKYTELSVKMAEVDSRSRSNQHRIDNLEVEIKAVHEQQISLVKIANSVENMGKTMVSLNEKVDEISEKQDSFSEKITTLENRPAQETKRVFDSIAEKILWVVVGGLIVWLLGSLIPGIPW